MANIINTDKDHTFDLVCTVTRALDDAKGDNIVVLELSKISTFADYFVIVSADNPAHMKSLARKVHDAVAKEGHKHYRVEGRDNSVWMLIDLGAVVLHILSQKARSYYALEEFWGDAEMISLDSILDRLPVGD